MRATGIVILALALAACAGGSTHLRQPAGALVVLEAATGDTGCFATTAGHTFRRVFPGGTGGLQPFVMPAGQALVVTDVDWQYRHPTGAAAAGRRAVLRLFLQNIADPTHQERVFESTIFLNADGEGGASEAMTAGFVMSDAAQLCLDTGEEPKGPPSGLQHAILRGYLIRS
jgi:hypothetical protein